MPVEGAVGTRAVPRQVHISYGLLRRPRTRHNAKGCVLLDKVVPRAHALVESLRHSQRIEGAVVAAEAGEEKQHEDACVSEL